jgi:hypothetical protein
MSESRNLVQNTNAQPKISPSSWTMLAIRSAGNGGCNRRDRQARLEPEVVQVQLEHPSNRGAHHEDYRT